MAPNLPHSTHEVATGRFLSRFEPNGVASDRGWGCLGMLAFIGSLGVAFVSVLDGASAWVFLLPVLMILPAVLMNQYHVGTRLDVDGGAVVETRTLGSLGGPRRQSVDLSQVSVVSLKVTRTVSRNLGSVSPTRSTSLHCYAFLEGSSPEYVYEGTSESQLREAGEYFAVALGVPLRLADGDVRTPSEICEPLRDRLARRSLPAATPVPWYEASHVTVEKDEAAGTTKFVIPNVGADRAIRAAIWLNVIVLGLLVIMLGLGQGLLAGAVVVALSMVWGWIRLYESGVVTVLPDGGLEVALRLPFGDRTERIAGDDLDDVSLYEKVTVIAKGWPSDIWFGAGLSSGELEWLEHELCLAIAGRSARS